GIALLIVGLDLRCLAPLDHVIVGDGIAVRRDEEARPLRGYQPRRMATARRFRCQRWRPELAQKAIHGRAALLVKVFRALRLHADDGWLHRLDDVSEACGTRGASAEECRGYASRPARGLPKPLRGPPVQCCKRELRAGPTASS